LEEAISRFSKTRWDKEKLRGNARRFSKERFQKEIKAFINSKVKS